MQRSGPHPRTRDSDAGLRRKPAQQRVWRTRAREILGLLRPPDCTWAPSQLRGRRTQQREGPRPAPRPDCLGAASALADSGAHSARRCPAQLLELGRLAVLLRLWGRRRLWPHPPADRTSIVPVAPSPGGQRVVRGSPPCNFASATLCGRGVGLSQPRRLGPRRPCLRRRRCSHGLPRGCAAHPAAKAPQLPHRLDAARPWTSRR
mmetsp:Transcript_26727/g.78885  ORF Transcript_26727/g.78885 Transcript_26727/m.78885 type:complete len:205 (-) Transcript_26727:545-1159(-)